jgi:NADH-quinone oxidoreductase subunit E
MSVRRLAPDAVQPAAFVFSKESKAWVDQQIAKYPAGRQASAVIPLLWKAQEQENGWVSRAAIEQIARMLDMPFIRVLEVATFYTMFNLEPVGRYFIQLCGTTPCMLRGAESLKKVCHDRIGDQRHVTADGTFSWLEVECLGACCNAPMVQINNDYFEDLTPESFGKLLDDLKSGKPVKIGPQNGRKTSEPEGGATTLTDPKLFDGSQIGAWRKRFDETAAAAATPPAAPQVDASTPAAAKQNAAKPKTDDVPGADAARSRPTDKVSSPTVSKPAAAAEERVPETAKPALLTKPRAGNGDDLKLIWGVGPKLAKMLNDMGVWHFDQVAAWSDDNLKWVDQNLGAFKGRAVRDKWIEQGKKLATGWRPDSSAGEKM